MAKAAPLAADLVKRITDFYLGSSDFNGLSLGRANVRRAIAFFSSFSLLVSAENHEAE
jgi:hypothetical protein